MVGVYVLGSAYSWDGVPRALDNAPAWHIFCGKPLDYIFHDARAPLLFDDLFRDSKGHMSFGAGRYLQHNAFRKAMGQPTGVDTTADGLPADLRRYLDSVVDLY